MKFIVAIDAQSRYSRPPVGRFGFVQSQGRLVWRKEATDDMDRLVTLTNEALAFLYGRSGKFKLGIYPWKDAPEPLQPERSPEPAPAQEDTPPPEEPISQDVPPLPIEVPPPSETRKLQIKRKA